jgi:anti-anti-sigma factor
VVAVAGEVDLATSDAFRAALEEASKRGPVTLDLDRCTFLDSCALGIIVEAAEVAETNGKLALSNVRGPVLKTLEMTGILTWDSIIYSDPPM